MTTNFKSAVGRVTAIALNLYSTFFKLPLQSILHDLLIAVISHITKIQMCNGFGGVVSRDAFG